MKERHSQLREILQHPFWCYSIPPYQRPYEWSIERWHGLVQDVLQAATQNSSHWIGIFLTAEATAKCPEHRIGGSHDCWEVIDGQQRLVTLRLLIKALQDHYAEFENPGGPPLPNDLNAFYAQSSDQQELNEVFDGTWRRRRELPVKPSSKTGVLTAYLYFRWLFWLGTDSVLSDEPVEFVNTSRKKEHASWPLWDKWTLALQEEKKKNPETLLKRSEPIFAVGLIDSVLTKLTLLELRHEPAVDEPPDVVFACLNGERMVLSNFDLVRNFIFSNCDSASRVSTYEKFWSPGENHLISKTFSSSTAKNPELFLYDYLISKGESGPQKGINRARSSRQFTSYWWSGRHGYDPSGKLDTFLKRELVPHMYYWVSTKSGAPVEIPDRAVHRFTEGQIRYFSRIEAMSSGPFTPLVLGLLNSYFEGSEDDKWLDERLNAIEGLIARHLLIGTNLSPFRSRTMRIASKIFGSPSHDFLTVFRSETPEDKIVRNAVENFHRRDRSLGQSDFALRLKPPQICAIFDGLEAELSGSLSTHIVSQKQSKESGFSIEHILPQDPNKWSGDLKAWGLSTEKIHKMETRVHEIGNITVLPPEVNASISNKRFHDKKKRLTDLKRPQLNVDSGWISKEQWTTSELAERTSFLVDTALKRWPRP